jgi:hypothetical protein
MGGRIVDEELLKASFLEAAKICLRNALIAGAGYFEVEQMVMDSFKDAEGKDVYCDIHG